MPAAELIALDNRHRVERHVASTGDLINELGGNAVVSALCGGIGLSTVSQWRTRGFPPWVHATLIRECGVRRIAYDPALFEPRPRGGRLAPKSGNPPEFLKVLVARTRAARKATGMTQAEMAAALNISHYAYQKYENRTRMPPHLIEPFSRITHVSVTSLLADPSDGDPCQENPTPTERWFYQQIGQLIRQRRKALGMTQDDLAAAMEITHGSVSRIETGETRVLVHTIYDFAEILDCLPGDLVPKPRRRCAAGSHLNGAA